MRSARDENTRVDAAIDSMAVAFVADAGSADDLDDLQRRGATLASRIDKQRRLQDSRERRAASYLVEVHKKFSIAVACIVFVLVGAPLGAMTRARGAAVSVALSLVFFFAYWMFLIGGEELADRGFLHPALALWRPPPVFGLLGGLLLLPGRPPQSGGQWRQSRFLNLAHPFRLQDGRHVHLPPDGVGYGIDDDLAGFPHIGQGIFGGFVRHPPVG